MIKKLFTMIKEGHGLILFFASDQVRSNPFAQPQNIIKNCPNAVSCHRRCRLHLFTARVQQPSSPLPPRPTSPTSPIITVVPFDRRHRFHSFLVSDYFVIFVCSVKIDLYYFLFQRIRIRLLLDPGEFLCQRGLVRDWSTQCPSIKHINVLATGESMNECGRKLC